MRTLLVEGWRFIPHSFAIVNQWQLLALMRRTDVRTIVRDLPYYGSTWRPATGLFDRTAEDRLRRIPRAAATDRPDATLRIAFPYVFSTNTSGLTAVFGAVEHKAIPPSCLYGVGQPSALARRSDLIVITPSQWSKEGFLNLGLRADQIAVVPHGVDLQTFAPDDDARSRTRTQLRISPDTFVFGNLGAQTPNKGIDHLMRAFAAVAARRPNASLLLKGIDSYYASRGNIQACLASLPAADRQRVADRIIYIGNTLSMQMVADVLRTCDAYVSPYRGEGFNMPILEAAACGVPVICTAGGPTDEFTTRAFTMRVDSTVEDFSLEGCPAQRLNPDIDQLIELMLAVIDDAAWRSQARAAGPSHVAAAHTWDHAVDRLVTALGLTAESGCPPC